MFRYPFNRYGLNNLIWWFKYRLQRKHKYHRVYLNLKPGYYEYQEIIEKVIASERFFWLFEYQYNQYKKLLEDQDPDNEIYTNQFHIVIKELRKAYLWFKKYKAKFEKRINDQEDNLCYFWPPSNPKALLYTQEQKDQIFEEYRKVSEFLYKTTTHYLEIIVRHRMFLDT